MTEDHHSGRAANLDGGGAPHHRLHVAARTDPGLVRANNEDSFFAGARVLVVADGMGGHAAGEVASRLVVDAIAPLDTATPGPDLSVDLVDATRRGNAKIAGVVAEHPALEGMGTTVTAILFDGRRAALAHVGDSRAYLYRAGVLHQLTHDDTFVQSLVDEGRITEAQAHDHPQRNLVLRALTGTDIDPSIAIRETRQGDRYLICSDGLCGVVGAESIADALADPDPDVAADSLIQLALEAGAPDNVTVIIADVVETDDAATGSGAPAGAASLDDPSSTNPLQRLTREMPRVPLPPIPEEPGGQAEILGGTTDIDDDEDDEPWDDDDVGDEADSHSAHDVPTGSTTDRTADDDAAAGDRPLRDNGATVGAVAAAAGGAGASAAARRSTRLRDRLRRNPSPAAARTAPTPHGRSGVSSDTARPPVRRRWYRPSVLVIAAAILVAAGITGSTIWVRHQYFVSDQGNLVVVFRGVDGSLLGWHFSTFEETSCAGNTNCTPMRVSDLQPAAQNQVRAGIKALNLVDARDVVQRLSGQLLPPCPTTRPGDADASGDAPPASSPETTDRTTTDTTTTSPAPTTKETTAATTRPAAVATTRAADPSRAAAGIVASTLAAANATGPPTSGGQVLAAAATGPGQVAAAQPGHIVIPAEAAPDIDAAAPAGSHAAAANVASDTPATDSTTTIEPVPTAITVTETVTATPLAPAPAVPGVTCRSTQ